MGTVYQCCPLVAATDCSTDIFLEHLIKSVFGVVPTTVLSPVLSQRSDTLEGGEKSYFQTKPSSIWRPTAARGRCSPMAPWFTSHRKSRGLSGPCFRISVCAGSESRRSCERLAVMEVADDRYPHQ